MRFGVSQLSHAIGAEISRIDLREPLDTSMVAEIRAAWLAHNVLLFRDQDLTPEQHIAFSRQFGELDDHRTRPDEQLPGHPEIFVVTNYPRSDGKPSRTRNTAASATKPEPIASSIRRAHPLSRENIR